MIVIIDYGMGNLGSIYNMLKKIGIKSCVSSNEEIIRNAEKLILPGVGSFDMGMNNLHNLGLIPVLEEKVLVEKVPILGICLGMQLFTKKSDEGNVSGLGWVEAETVKFNFCNNSLKLPHMGWNTVKIIDDKYLFKNMYECSKFYFVHTYHVQCRDIKLVQSMTEYGYEFVSSIKHNNIMGTQFHPEKSHKYGMLLLKNFAELNLNDKQ